MHYFGRLIFFMFMPVIAHASENLNLAIENARMACGGISGQLEHMKTMAGINTAVTGVGTVAGGVALGTGIAKVKVDKKAAQLEAELVAEIELLNKLASQQKSADLSIIPEVDIAKLGSAVGENEVMSVDDNSISQKEQELAQVTEKSKKLGNWRTGMMAANTATNITGAAIAGTNRMDGELKTRIAECVLMVDILSRAHMQARISNDSTEAELARAENIVHSCADWGTVNIDSINNKSTGATVASGVGAGMGLAGTIVSATANSDRVRGDNSASGRQKEKNLNATSNILAGGTTVATGAAVVFNATQIGAIKRAVTVADNCEKALGL